MQNAGWVSVRCVFRHHGDPQTYEERVTLWRTPSMSAAIEMAESEALDHAADLSTPPGPLTEYTGLAQAYLLSDVPGNGAEVFSLIRASAADPEDYLDTFFDTGAERQAHEPSD